MNKKIIFLCCILISTMFLINSCKKGRKVTNPETVNKIFWDFEFGMERQVFFDTCFALNERKVITQGSKNTSVEYKDTTNFKGLVYVNFYPKFNAADVVEFMPVRYNYFAWAPWNKELSADSLLLEVVDFLKTDQKIDFDEEKTIDGKLKLVHYNGPKSITAFSEDDYYVKVTYENENYKDK